MKYRIYPSIGIARLGDSSELFIGPEVIGSRGRELDTGAEVTRFKDAQFRIRKQAARFHLFQQEDDNAPVAPAVLPPNAKIEWTVHLANKKDGIVRPTSPPDTIPAGQTLRPQPDPSRAARIISARDSILSDAGTAATKALQGTHAGNPVKLGELRLDSQGRLIVTGGALVSASHSGPSTPSAPLTGFFYNNPDWHDDVSDGPVGARILFPDGHAETAEGAWIAVAPPDFAPGAEPIVTLFDELLQVAILNHWDSPWTRLPAVPSFTQDIYPIVRRARSLGWVHVDASQFPTITNEKNWQRISQDFIQLGKKGAATHQLRSDARSRIMKATTLLSDYTIPDWQAKVLSAWLNDQFTEDWVGPPQPATEPTAVSLTRAALQGAVGQGFFPGIEAGRILTDPSIYRLPFDFRLAQGVLTAGDLTALMAQPWQADFLKCSGNWWPSQRPDLAPRPGGAFALWQRPVGGGEHAKLIQMVRRLGMITVQVNANGVQVSAAEEGRDPTL